MRGARRGLEVVRISRLAAGFYQLRGGSGSAASEATPGAGSVGAPAWATGFDADGREVGGLGIAGRLVVGGRGGNG